jgi:hypothetical protein
MQEAITRVPFLRIPARPVSLPLCAEFKDGLDREWLWTPGVTHRAIHDGYLEFGSLHVFRNSWMSVADLEMANVHVEAEMRFTLRREEVRPWIGIMVRSQGYYADYGHLVYLDSAGQVLRTIPREPPPKAPDELIGRIPGFDADSDAYVPFIVSMDHAALRVDVGGVEGEFSVVEMPHPFSRGRVLLQGAFARVGIRRVAVSEP